MQKKRKKWAKIGKIKMWCYERKKEEEEEDDEKQELEFAEGFQ